MGVGDGAPNSPKGIKIQWHKISDGSISIRYDSKQALGRDQGRLPERDDT